ncbi:MAG: hypothetical protein COT00_03965 [Candidatus Omnitrophica bacterium CG07_land_8_20_14_0_80_50_8]|nr:MAG: hypothetical protein COT00_03965 [Candidatus Omnitrophica bacterium CG07_land_8_20_14_0_80_50_8]
MGQSKAIHQIEERMGTLEPESLRYKILDTARRFKSSWIDLGQCLFSVYKDKLFKDWGYLTFEAYCLKEIGIKQLTAMKLLKSYSFLEHEEPAFLKRHSSAGSKPSQIPSVESVNSLRLAKQSERISEGDYATLRADVLENAKEDAEVKKKIRYILNSHNPQDSIEVKEDRKLQIMKRIVLSLGISRNELQNLSCPERILKKIDELVDLLADFQK